MYLQLALPDILYFKPTDDGFLLQASGKNPRYCLMIKKDSYWEDALAEAQRLDKASRPISRRYLHGFSVGLVQSIAHPKRYAHSNVYVHLFNGLHLVLNFGVYNTQAKLRCRTLERILSIELNACSAVSGRDRDKEMNDSTFISLAHHSYHRRMSARASWHSCVVCLCACWFQPVRATLPHDD